jgi:hypothetical protein
MRPRTLVAGALIAAIFLPHAARAQGRTIPALPALTETEELRLAESAAPAEISRRATILVHGASGLRTARAGSNGYVCFVEWFTRATTMWPVCYEPEIARVMVPLNEALESHRAAGKTEEAFFAARDSITAAVRTPRPGGLSYRLSPEMWTAGPQGKRGGPWMILVTAPDAKREQIGLPAQATPGVRAVPGSFGIAGKGATGYYWIDVPAPRDSTAGGAPGRE